MPNGYDIAREDLGDFDNYAMMDIVAYNRLGLGDSGFTETYFYQQLPDSRYSRTYQINSSGRATGFVQYGGKLRTEEMKFSDAMTIECR